jgi:hypothetical protein
MKYVITMRWWIGAAMMLACSSNDVPPPNDAGAETAPVDAHVDAPSDALMDAALEAEVDACKPPASDPEKAAYDALDATELQNRLSESCGSTAVTLDGGAVSITNRWAPAAKAQYRAYFEGYMKSLGLSPVEMPYTTAHNNGETQGHNVEVVLPGQSPDSIVIIIHYDSMGPGGAETTNPGCDDDMTGMATMMEAARIFSAPCVTRDRTIRFVATDYEEWLNPGLEGARVYASYIQKLAEQKGFFVVAAIDYEQSGWNCASDSVCSPDAGGVVFDAYDCSGDSANFKSTMLGDELQTLAGTLSPLSINRGCMAQNSDHYAMWEIGVPSIVTSEHLPLSNPHFDWQGGDTIGKIDHAYHANIARLSLAFTARLAGVHL